MAMLIDCYNLLHRTMPPSLAGLDETRLCRLLAAERFKPMRRGAGIVVVCDGVVKPGGLARSPEAGVQLRYSGRKRTADQMIMEMIAGDTAPRRLAVVSSDRQIQRSARRRRARVIDSDRFVRELAAAAATGDPRPAPAAPDELDDEQVDAWLAEFGFDSADHAGDEDDDDR